MTKILVVDDHDLVRAGIVHMLDEVKGFNIIAEASSGEEAVKLARELDPDVVLIDVKMPGIGGLEATRRIVQNKPAIRVIAVTMCTDEPFPSRLLKAGAAGYLTKGAGPEEMIRAIRAVEAGQRYVSAEVAQTMALAPFSSSSASPFDQLSERELQIMMMIANCNSVQDISDKLCLSPKTVNTYRYRIFDKLKIASDVEMTVLAMRHGMIDSQLLG